MEYEIYKTDELTHWGIRGMKWGVRRYQNPDGTLTAAGRKRYNAELAKVREQEQIVKNREAVKGRMDRLKARQDAVAERKKALDDAKSGKAEKEAKKAEKEAKRAEKEAKKAEKEAAKKNEPPRNKSVKNMTDEELAAHIRRIEMEKRYETLTAKPETVKKGNNFVKDFMDKSVTPALQQAGQQLIKNKLIDVGEKKLGLKKEATKPVVDSLKEEFNTLNYTKQIRKLKDELADMDNSSKVDKSSGSNETKSNVSTAKSQVAKSNNTPVSDLKSPSDAEWQAFKQQYSWGVEPWATDRVDD